MFKNLQSGTQSATGADSKIRVDVSIFFFHYLFFLLTYPN
jgi:hypothetical protein